MKKNIRYIIWAVPISIVLSCSINEPDHIPEQDLVRIPVSVKFDVSSFQEGTPGTKTIMEPDYSVPTENQIANFVILQFDGVTSSAHLLTDPVYIDHYPLDGSETITLAATESACAVIAVANTFGRIAVPSGVTLGTFLEQGFTNIKSLSDVFTTDEGNDYFRMSGSCKLNAMTTGTTLSISLKRNVSKIVINVTNSTSGEDEITIDKIQLSDINGKYYYLTNPHPDLISEDASLAFIDPYYPDDPKRFNIEQNYPGGSSNTFVFYVPANLRGTISNTNQYSKVVGAPEGSTFFRLCCSYGTPASKINYTYYLGGNLVNDFNLLPDTKYTYNITIGSKGDATYDYRIEDMREIEFTTDANCYMVHPPEVAGQSRTYIFPVRRAAVFWNQENINGGVYGANSHANYSSYAWDGGTEWTAEVLWSDFDLSSYTGEDAFLQTTSGVGFDPTKTTVSTHTQPYIRFKVQSGMRGNVLIGVKYRGIIQWSWHIWITDYNPDVNATPALHTYIYDAINGKIHRYNSAIWSTTATDLVVGYANGFIMDRNLGAMGTGYYDSGSQGCYYEYGRKDPFLDRDIESNNNKFYLGGTEYSDVVNASRRIAYSEWTADENKNIRYSVTHPTTYIVNGERWTSASDDLGYVGNGQTWKDPKFWEHTDNDTQNILELKKSIYDPCPPGWKVPLSSIWADFSSETTTPVGSFEGRHYFPEGLADSGIFYPASGYRDRTDGNLNYKGNVGYYWSAHQASEAIAYKMMLANNNMNPSRNWYQTEGETVRCIRE